MGGVVTEFQSVKVPILNNEYYVTVVWGNLEKAKTYILSITDNKADFCDMGNLRGVMFAVEDFSYQPVIYLVLSPEDDKFYSTLAHEATHAVKCIWDKLEEAYVGEIFAYSVGAIVGAVEKQVKGK